MSGFFMMMSPTIPCPAAKATLAPLENQLERSHGSREYGNSYVNMAPAHENAPVK